MSTKPGAVPVIEKASDTSGKSKDLFTSTAEVEIFGIKYFYTLLVSDELGSVTLFSEDGEELDVAMCSASQIAHLGFDALLSEDASMRWLMAAFALFSVLGPLIELTLFDFIKDGVSLPEIVK